MAAMFKRYAVALACLLVCGSIWAEAAVVPLPRGHSHNDYHRERPLLDALDHGLCSVEADIYLVDGALLVAHDRKDLRPEKTLQALYLDPLRARAQANGGRVFPGGPSITLLIDIKDDGRTTYARLRDVLGEYKDILTSFTNDSTTEGAVTVIISGSCPTEMILAESPRLAAIDGRPGDLEANPNPHTHPLISESWLSLFDWKGSGPFPEDQAAKLKAMVEKAHANGQRVRFWGLPLKGEVNNVLYDMGVDLLNTDFPAKLQAFLLEKQAQG
jgi:hypothetical protein